MKLVYLLLFFSILQTIGVFGAGYWDIKEIMLNGTTVSFTSVNASDVNVTRSLSIDGVNVTPGEYLKNGTDASLKNLNSSTLNVTRNTDMQGQLHMHNNVIRDLNELSAPDGSAIRFNAPSPFSGMNQSITVMSNQTLGAKIITHCLIDLQGEKVIACWQAGGNNSGAYERNSGGNFPDLGITNASKLTNMVEMWSRFGIESNLNYFSGANKTSRAALYAFESQQLHLHDDLGQGNLEVEGDINFFLRANTDFDIFGRMHIEQNRTEQIGISIGGEKSALDALFIVGGQIDPFERLTPLVANHWVSTTEPECHDMQCMMASGSSGSLDFAAADNFSVNDLENCNVSFWATTTGLDSGDRFRVTMNNNTGSGDIDVFNITDGINVVDEKLNFTFPSTFFNASKVTLTFNLSANNPINEMAFVDNVKVLCTTTTTTAGNITRLDAEILLGDSGQRIFWNDTTNTLEIPGNVSEFTLTVVDEVIIGSFTVGPDKVNISNSGDVNATNFYGDAFYDSDILLTNYDDTDIRTSVNLNYTNLNDKIQLRIANGTDFLGANIFTGSDTETIGHSGFVVDGNDIFVEGMLGVEGDAFFDSDMYVAGTIYTVNINSTLVNSTSGTYCNLLTGNCVNITNGNVNMSQNLAVDGTGYFGGNVGIGTASPATPLHISGSDLLQFRIEDVDVGGSVEMQLKTDDQAWNILVEANGNFDIQDGTGGNAVFKLQAGAPVNSLFVASDGDVGIGTANPLADLQIQGHMIIRSGIKDLILLNGTDAGATQLKLSNTEADMFIGTNNNIAYIGLIDGLNANNLNIDSSGNVGIGTTTPGAPLEVNGNVNVTGVISGTDGKVVNQLGS